MRAVFIPAASVACLALLELGARADDARPVPELSHMREVLTGVEPGALVVLDIDNTLIEPTTGLGSDSWFYALLDELAAAGSGADAALAEAMRIWNAVQADIEVHAVEAETPRLLRALQARGVRTLALTARTLEVATVTERQLRGAGIDFSRSGWPKELGVKGMDDARLIHGVVYAGERNDKGQVLAEVLRRLELRPTRVLFIDDKLKHAANVRRALEAAGLRISAYRYAGADARVRAFDPAAAREEYHRWRAARPAR